MIVIAFLKWVVKTIALSFLFAFPLALVVVAVGALFGDSIQYWPVYRICFWGLIVVDILSAAIKGWE